MTNLEKFRAMPSYKLAAKLYLDYISDCNYCPCDKYNFKECYEETCDCICLIEKWLELESE